MKDSDTRDRFIELRASGKSYDSIAFELGISKQTCINWSRELSLKIENLKALQLDALHEKYFLHKQHRIKLFGEKLEKIRNELEQRDLSNIPTEKLFDLLLKYATCLKSEASGTVFQANEPNAALEASLQSMNVTSWSA